MSWSEVSAILKADGEKSRETWELTRLQCFYSIIAQSGTKHFKKPADVFQLPWDKEEKAKPKAKKPQPKPLTPDEFKQLVEQINIPMNG